MIPETVDITFTHGHLMHIPDDVIEDVCMNILKQRNIS